MAAIEEKELLKLLLIAVLLVLLFDDDDAADDAATAAALAADAAATVVKEPPTEEEGPPRTLEEEGVAGVKEKFILCVVQKLKPTMAFDGIELRTFDTFGIEPSASYSFLSDLRRAKAASIAEAEAAQRRRRDAGESHKPPKQTLSCRVSF